VEEQLTLEVRIQGMDCAECTLHVQRAISSLDGVSSVEVLLASEKAIVEMDPRQVDIGTIAAAVKAAGYSTSYEKPDGSPEDGLSDLSRPLLTLLGLVFGVVLFVVVFGEWLGLFEELTGRVPFPLGVAIVLVGGYPVFRNVVRALMRRQITSHTLMSLGAAAALVVGQWATAAVVVFFMRTGDYVERFTTERARRAVKDLDNLAPQRARVIRDGVEVEIDLAEVKPGETVVVRPGEVIPVDGEVIAGQATVNQATITGESMPMEAGPGTRVFAATLATLGSLRVRATNIGVDSTFGQVIKMVEQAETHRGEVQRLADRFSGYYLPVVVFIAALTYIIRQDALATAAVLIVACSCAFALATPIAMLASIGAAAKQGVLIKGGKYLESLANVDVLLIDKTGTLTFGKPEITDIIVVNGEREKRLSSSSILQITASAERFSEHPLARAVREAAELQGLPLNEPEDFEALPGVGVRARINGFMVEVGNRRMMSECDCSNSHQDTDTYVFMGNDCVKGSTMIQPKFGGDEGYLSVLEKLEAEGKTVFFVRLDGRLAGLLATADTLRPEVPEAIQTLRDMGMKQVELLTGDNYQSAATLAQQLGVKFRAELLPKDKIAVVQEYQSLGNKVAMVGDGVNDAPALAQADVGIAVGAAGNGVAMEAAHIALMREDWILIPEVIRIARRTMKVVKGNIGFTSAFNLVGLSMAALGYLPPILAAVVQAIPDLGILANSSRLLKR
jgi:P-type Cu+ transporter